MARVGNLKSRRPGISVEVHVSDKKYVLIGSPGWGSAIAEALLDLSGLPYQVEDIDASKPTAESKRLTALNPLAQVPTLLLPDGTVMTESAAIALHLADRAPGAELAPPPGDPTRAAFLRWLVFIVANVYPMYTVGDDPSRFVSGEAAQKELRASTDAYRAKSWGIVEAAIGPRPWFLGTRFSALDVYAKVMTHWRPRRDWFKDNCPKLMSVALAADKEPRLAKVWQRNFPAS
jgi:GST-like protein